MRLHLACGDIYLKGYVNIDRCGLDTICLKDKTTLKAYYKNRIPHHPQGVVVDVRIDLICEEWGKRWENKVSEIVMINGIEHFTKEEAVYVVGQCFLALKKGGRFILDYPDISGAMDCETNKSMRLIYGSVWNPHKWGYDRDTIKVLLNKFSKVEFKIIVPHSYPSIGVVATK